MPTPSPYVVCAAPRAREWGLDPVANGVRRVDPWRVSDAPFVRRVHALSTRNAAAEDRPLPAWALYDCAASSGFIAGIERPGAPDPEPLTMLAATPCARVGDWHALALTGDPAHLGATLELAIRIAKPDRLGLVVPWTDPLLRNLADAHRPMVITAWTPAHRDPASATLAIDTRRTDPGRDAPTPERTTLRTGDREGVRHVQSLLESGRQLRLVAVRDNEITLGSERA